MSFLLLFILLLALPSINMDSLMNGTQSGKSIFFLYSVTIISALWIIRFWLNQELIKIKLSTIDLLLATVVLYILLRNNREELVHSLLFIELAGLSILYFISRQQTHQGYLMVLLALVAGGLVQAIYGNLQLWGYFPSHHGIFKMTGSFFNPGPYSGYLAAVFPVSLGFYLFNISVSVPTQHPIITKLNSYSIRVKTFFKKIPFSNRLFYNNGKGEYTSEKQVERPANTYYYTLKSFALISIISMCLVLPASRSRAAWLAVVISSSYLLWIKYLPLRQLKARVNTPAKRFLLVSSLVILLISIGSGLYYFKKGSADGRLLIWKVSAEMIKDKPIFGHGADKFAANYMNYQAAYFKPNPDVPEAIHADNVTYAYNEFLKLTVENGIVGLLLALGVIWGLFFWKSKKSEEGRRQKLINPILLAARGGLLSILVFALFSYPSDILPIRMLLVLFMAMVASHQRSLFRLGRKETAPLPSQREVFAGTAVLYAALAVALVAVYPASQYLTRQYQAYQSWKDASDIYNVGAYPECLDDFELAYPHLKTNGAFLVQYGKALEMAEKYESSITILNQAKGNLNNTILYTCLGNNYKALGRNAEAEQAYLHAWNMAPARFYPLYLLAKLYDETGQQEKAAVMAKEVMEKEVKIESTAVEEIKEEMRKIIGKEITKL